VDYKLHYKKLIETRFHRNLDDGVYYEKHHIIPRCLGGTNSPQNLIYLTAREHYIAHWLLYRIKPHSNGLSYAFWVMNWPGTTKMNREIRISSRMFEEGRTAMRTANSRKMTTNNHCIGKKLSTEHKQKISLGCKGKMNTAEQRKKQSLAQMKPINQYTKDDIFIKKWNSQKEIYDTLKVLGVGDVCNGNRKTAGGFKWKWCIKH
jgi:hypothetical protein